MDIDKTTKGIFRVRIYLKEVFGCAEHQENASYGLGYKLTLKGNNENHVLSHPAGAIDAASLSLAERVIIDDLNWYVPHFTPNISNQKLMLGHIENRAATEITYFER